MLATALPALGGNAASLYLMGREAVRPTIFRRLIPPHHLIMLFSFLLLVFYAFFVASRVSFEDVFRPRPLAVPLLLIFPPPCALRLSRWFTNPGD